MSVIVFFFFFQAEDGIRDKLVTGVQTCALPISLRRARIYVESREAAMRESGDIIAAGRAPLEIGEVVAGAAPGRQSPDEVTLFKSVGVAVEDVVTADLVYRKAARR